MTNPYLQKNQFFFALNAEAMGREIKEQECLQSSKRRQIPICKRPTVYSLKILLLFFKNANYEQSYCVPSALEAAHVSKETQILNS